MIMMVRFHQHGRCLRIGVHKVDLTVLLFVMEDPRLFPIMHMILLPLQVSHIAFKYPRWRVGRQQTDFDNSNHLIIPEAVAVPKPSRKYHLTKVDD